MAEAPNKTVQSQRVTVTSGQETAVVAQAGAETKVVAQTGGEKKIVVSADKAEARVIFQAGDSPDQLTVTAATDSPDTSTVVVKSGDAATPDTTTEKKQQVTTTQGAAPQAVGAAPQSATPESKAATAQASPTPAAGKPADTTITTSTLPPARSRGVTLNDLKAANVPQDMHLDKTADGAQQLHINPTEDKDNNSVVVRYGNGGGFMVSAADPVDPKTGQVFMHAPAGHDPNLSVDDMKGLEVAFNGGGATGVLNYASAHHLCVTTLPKAGVVVPARIVGGTKVHHHHHRHHRKQLQQQSGART
ncbi:MAG: hypothetical protein JO126_05945 [Alphaproteobacteria bacterium]|nr:hypothetical protein [Alphaproteobacteria bacterium]MBV8548979.1 hypothetical protein [Alphaproteobacteria bacterium]